MPEITLKIKTVKVGKYNIDDMVQLFGKRIDSAIYVDDHSKGLVAKKMNKLCKKWKFWNNDIRNAYKQYYGIIRMPYSIIHETPLIIENINNPIITKYANKVINTNYYKKL